MSTDISIGREPMTGVDFASITYTPINVQDALTLCVDHKLSPDTIGELNGETFGFCEFCTCRIRLPENQGLDFDKAGILIGRALTLDNEEHTAELMADLMALEAKIKLDMNRLLRALEAIEQARKFTRDAVFAKGVAMLSGDE